MIYTFDRFVDGVLMAEGCTITKATSEEDAYDRARAMYPPNPKMTFTLTKTTPTRELSRKKL